MVAQKRVAIYARVSTIDKGQDPENQLRELRDWVINSGHIISRDYVDYESGRKGAETTAIRTSQASSRNKTCGRQLDSPRDAGAPSVVAVWQLPSRKCSTDIIDRCAQYAEREAATNQGEQHG